MLKNNVSFLALHYTLHYIENSQDKKNIHHSRVIEVSKSPNLLGWRDETTRAGGHKMNNTGSAQTGDKSLLQNLRIRHR